MNQVFRVLAKPYEKRSFDRGSAREGGEIVLETKSEEEARNLLGEINSCENRYSAWPYSAWLETWRDGVMVFWRISERNFYGGISYPVPTPTEAIRCFMNSSKIYIQEHRKGLEEGLTVKESHHCELWYYELHPSETVAKRLSKILVPKYQAPEC